MNILLVHNSRSPAAAIADMIRKCGVEPEITSIGDHLNAMISKSNYELVLIDIENPVLSCNAIAEIKQAKPDLKIIAVTAHNTPELESSVRGMGIIYYLTIPFEPNELNTILSYFSNKKGAS